MRKLYGLWGLFIFGVLFIGTMMTSYASPIDDDPQGGASMSNNENEIPGNGIAVLGDDADPYTGKVYIHNSRYKDCDITYGIDVSSHNGSIDWNKVKKAGIDYVMIRAAYRGYGSSGSLNPDVNFKRNIEGALDAGLQVGAYIFSQAITRAEAVEEADYLVSLVKGYDITLPLVMDYEYASTGSGAGGRLYDAHLSKDKATDVCRAFGRSISQDGYTPMIYANKSMLENQLYAKDLSDRYKVWLANYTTETSYQGEYDVWQYSSKGHVDGINGYVDCNFWYGESGTVYDGVDYSAVYNYEYYISKHADIKAAYGENKRGALWHFVNQGMIEGRQGSEEFNVYVYRDAYADLRAAYKNDLKKYYMHYVNYGKAEGRSGKIKESSTIYNGVDYSAVYNFNYYVGHYADLKQAFGTNKASALSHFVNIGMKEGRQGCEEFNVYTYKNRYADLRNVYGKDLKKYYLHYNATGKKEGRSGSGTSLLVDPAIVYNGIDYSNIYNYNYYVAKNSDIKKTYGDDDLAVLSHFVNQGTKEGRQGNEEFNVYVYKNRYPDLRKAYGNDLQKYYFHYNSYGKKEGRSGSGTSSIVDPVTIYKGTDYSDVYNYHYYVDKYDEVKSKYGNDDVAALEYFVNEGMAKGHQASEEFDVNYYRNRYPDLTSAYGDDLKKYFNHYMNQGKAEGREGIEPEAVETIEMIPIEEAELLEEPPVDSMVKPDEELPDEEVDDTISEETLNDQELSEQKPGSDEENEADGSVQDIPEEEKIEPDVDEPSQKLPEEQDTDDVKPEVPDNGMENDSQNVPEKEDSGIDDSPHDFPEDKEQEDEQTESVEENKEEATEEKETNEK